MFKRKELVDPVCGMMVKMENSFKSTYLGETYYFCSEYCKTEFEKNPEGYAAHPSRITSHSHDTRCC
ncbi:MAG: YHS domain-containing protein [Candidatus Caldarchaeales archaeon]